MTKSIWTHLGFLGSLVFLFFLYVFSQESVFLILFFIVLRVWIFFVVMGIFVVMGWKVASKSSISSSSDSTAPVLTDTSGNKVAGEGTPPLPLPASSTLQYIKKPPQVFNVPGNQYDYENAQAVCSAYGSRLASYDEIEKAYEEGAEWCNYGWSSGQMALYPTQQKSYQVLQGIKGHEHDCGHPGINGGYFPDAKLKFGVNCYGYKPKINSQETDLMHNTSPYPVSGDQARIDELMKSWKAKINNILVAPYNYTQWSRI
jgi:hypothetical protein